MEDLDALDRRLESSSSHLNVHWTFGFISFEILSLEQSKISRISPNFTVTLSVNRNTGSNPAREIKVFIN